jgi:glycogen debranching enzyme
MWHEISQSAAHLDWFHAYPFIYRHTDISPLYVSTIRDIWRQSNDRKLLESSWPSLEAAWRYCLAHVDPKDGLLAIPAGEMGVNENSADKVDKELPTEMTWIEGAAAFSELADAVGKHDVAESARAAAQRAKSALSKFWDPARQYYNEGIFANGMPFTQEMASTVDGVADGLFPPEESKAVFQKLSEAPFLAPWGLRSIPSTAANYQPESYQHGSVWPITTASYVQAALVLHHPEQAWPIWKSLVEDSSLDSPGHMPEVLSGAAFRVLDVSVPQQAFSTAALLNATLHGILGMEPNAPAHELRFAPHLPPQWKQVSITNYPFGGHKLSFTMQRSGDEFDLSVKNDGPPFELECAPMLDGSGRVTAAVNGKPVEAEVREYGSDRHAVVRFRVEHEASLSLKQASR